MTGRTNGETDTGLGAGQEMILAALRILRAGLPEDALAFTVCAAGRDRSFGPIRPEINRILYDDGVPERRLRAAADMLATFDPDGLARIEATVSAERNDVLGVVERARHAGRRAKAPYRTLLRAAGPAVAAEEALALNDEFEVVLELLDKARRDKAELAERLALAEMASETDALTGIPNRRYLDRILAAQIALATARGEPLSVALVDIDRFKSFNDRHGHEIGDLVLRLVARTVGGALRDGDTIARFGGEEFVVVLPTADAGVAAAVADRLRRTLESREVKNRRTGIGYGRVTASFGVATLWPGEQAEDLLRRADVALYRAKANGRNRVETAA